MDSELFVLGLIYSYRGVVWSLDSIYIGHRQYIGICKRFPEIISTGGFWPISRSNSFDIYVYSSRNC